MDMLRRLINYRTIIIIYYYYFYFRVFVIKQKVNDQILIKQDTSVSPSVCDTHRRRRRLTDRLGATRDSATKLKLDTTGTYPNCQTLNRDIG